MTLKADVTGVRPPSLKGFCLEGVIQILFFPQLVLKYSYSLCIYVIHQQTTSFGAPLYLDLVLFLITLRGENPDCGC